MADIPSGDTNLLWVRSQGICAHPECADDLLELDGYRWVTQGERAHIRSERPDGPRHDPQYANPNRYENLLLLCRRHHKLIDAQPDLYPVELLERWKGDHEVPALGSPSLTVSPPPEGARYVRRTTVFQDLKASVREDGKVALTGISGIGKSQLAADYFRAEAEAYSVRTWIRADDSAILFSDFALLGSYVGVERGASESIADYSARIREALSSRRGWLLVFDGAPDEAALSDFLPTGAGHVIVTSQAQSWSKLARIQVPDLTVEEVEAILTADPAFARIDDVAMGVAAVASGGLPLCVVQLMGFRSATGMEALQAIQLLSASRSELLNRGAPPDHLSAQAALEGSLAALSEQAGDLLLAFAYLAADPFPLPEYGLGNGSDDWPGAAFATRLSLEDAVAELRSYSLVERDGELLTVHSLVQEVVKKRPRPDEVSVRAKLAAVLLVVGAMPERVDREDMVADAVVLLPHVRAIVANAAGLPASGGLLAGILNRLAPTHGFIADQPSVLRDLTLALELLDGDEVADPLLRASILSNLSTCYADTGDHDSAIEFASQALELKRALGAEPESLGITLGAYGCQLEVVGRLDEALEAHREAIGRLAADSGRLLADAEIDEARVLRALGRHDDARVAAERALGHAKQDPSAWTERAGAHLALCLYFENAGNIRAALSEAERAVDAAEQFDGPSTALAQSLGTRGRLRGIAGQAAHGVADFRRSLDLFQSVEGRSRNYALCLGNLGAALVRLGLEAGQPATSADGLARLRESIEIIRQLVPDGHPDHCNAEMMLNSAQSIVFGADVCSDVQEHPGG